LAQLGGNLGAISRQEPCRRKDPGQKRQSEATIIGDAAEEPATSDELKALLVPCKDDVLNMWPVNRQRIGNVRNKDREVALPEALS
jgi:hypothetical protein